MVTRCGDLCEIQLDTLIDNLLSTAGALGKFLHQLVGQVHEIPVVGIGLIKLQHREFWIMPSRQPFVAKVAVNLIHPLKPADHQTLQKQFWRHP
jgi:hypothetical protein